MMGAEPREAHEPGVAAVAPVDTVNQVLSAGTGRGLRRGQFPITRIDTARVRPGPSALF
jgi:hypothetical protein